MACEYTPMFEDSFPSMDLFDIDIPLDLDLIFLPFDISSEDQDSMLFDEILSTCDSDTEQTNTLSHTAIEQKPVQLDCKPQHQISLSFINPPESLYHVRYLSEIANPTLDEDSVDTKGRMKKNVSGRYLKGTHGRHITITLPTILSEHSNLYIRVTRLTVPYQNRSFIHPYPLLYAYKKKNKNKNKKQCCDVILANSSIYFRINKEELYSHFKSFSHLILTRLKQCHLKHINSLIAFDDSELSYPFEGANAKSKIALYQLKRSQLDFRLVIKSEQPETFSNTDIFCRSNELLEEEGVECKKSSTL
ncbi:unnamed protein product [Adineta ricciae]|uniref:Uncharacterized protein n=1 Tax=Adineta ricciae TaxID=249248 RepID=A0A813T1E9_ADIRI|nr:unnamed protein product [Adineta ricciae]